MAGAGKLYNNCRPKSVSLSGSRRKNCSSWVLIGHTRIYYGKQESQYVIYILSLGTAYDSALLIRLAKSQDYTDNEIAPLKTHMPASSAGRLMSGGLCPPEPFPSAPHAAHHFFRWPRAVLVLHQLQRFHTHEGEQIPSSWESNLSQTSRP